MFRALSTARRIGHLKVPLKLVLNAKGESAASSSFSLTTLVPPPGPRLRLIPWDGFLVPRSGSRDLETWACCLESPHNRALYSYSKPQ